MDKLPDRTSVTRAFLLIALFLFIVIAILSVTSPGLFRDGWQELSSLIAGSPGATEVGSAASAFAGDLGILLLTRLEDEEVDKLVDLFWASDMKVEAVWYRPSPTSATAWHLLGAAGERWELTPVDDPDQDPWSTLTSYVRGDAVEDPPDSDGAPAAILVSFPNSHEDPFSEIVLLLEAAGAITYSTDRPETIVVETAGRRYQITMEGVLALNTVLLPIVENAVGPTSTSAPTPSPTRPQDVQPTPPIRAAFYYPWFPQAWDQQGVSPYTNFTPELGFYDSGSPEVISAHLVAMQYANVQAGIASWWGRNHHTDQRMATILENTAGSEFRWSIYYEPEGQGDPSVEQLQSDLTYLKDRYGGDPSFLRVDGRFVIFVYADSGDGCAMAERWEAANALDAYLVLKVFAGYRDCPHQPDGWHQYGPAQASDSQVPFSYTISPGFWKVGEDPRLERDADRWRANIGEMVASGATFQLITTFNEWGEGTSLEAAQEWSSASGYGVYLDALHELIPSSPAPDGEASLETPAPLVAEGAVLVGAGDIADCDRDRDEFTAAILDEIPGIVFTTGDNVYESGAPGEFSACYQPSWGRHKDRTRPSVGNHEYLTAGASGYFDYFGDAAGDPAQGYYSYDLGAWHIVVLNTNCSKVGGCGGDSPQGRWLREDLAAHPAACSLAYFHHPRWSSGKYQINESVEPLYQALYDFGVDLALTGHAHNYERFAPQDPQGNLDLARGIRQIVVGTGGKNLASVSVNVLPNSEVRNEETFGVLKLTLYPTSYEWQFIPEPGKSFTDSGVEACR